MKRQSPKRIRARLLTGLFVTLCVLAALTVILPMVMQSMARTWLQEQGLETSISFVGFNLNTGTFLVEDAQGKNNSQQGFVLHKALLEINWHSLFKRQLDIQRFKVDGLTLELVSSDKGFSVAGIPVNGDSKAQQQENETPGTDNAETTSWSVQVQQVDLHNIKACHDNPTIADSDAFTTGQMLKACIQLDHLKWLGHVSWSAPGPGQPVTAGIRVNGDLQLEGLWYRSDDHKQVFAHLGKLVVENFDMNGTDHYHVDELGLHNVNLLQQSKQHNAPYLLSWQALKLIKPVYKVQLQGITISAVALSGLNLNIVRRESGIAGLPVLDEEQESSQQDTADKENNITFAIRDINIDGGSQVTFHDKTVKPEFSETLSDIKVSLKEIDSANAGLKSQLSTRIQVSDYGKIIIDGTVQPFAERITLDLKQDIKHIDLANYNVYGKTYVGHRIRNGELNLKQDVKIINGQLDSNSEVVLKKLRVESLQGEEEKKYKGHLEIPLTTALFLLRDSDDNINLSIPVSGDVNSPDFSLGDVIATVTGKVIQETIIDFYTPFGLLGLLGSMIDPDGGLQFEPVEFMAGKAELGEQGRQSLSKLAELLNKRTHLELTFCGYPAKSDMLARYKLPQTGSANNSETKAIRLDDKQISELLALFKSRMDNMKKYMVTQLKVDPGQVQLCSEPDSKEWVTGIDKKPEIAISI